MRPDGSPSGFSVIEIVVAITILGILAAFAIPRFAALEVESHTAARDALAGSIRSGAALSHALWLAQGRPANVTMEGQKVAMVNGYPSLATIGSTIGHPAGFTYTAGTGVFLKKGAAATCTVTYSEAGSPHLAPTSTTGGAC